MRRASSRLNPFFSNLILTLFNSFQKCSLATLDPQEEPRDERVFPYLTMAWSLLEVAPMLLRTQTGAAMEISLPLGRREVLKAWPVFQSWTDDRDSRTSH